MLCTVLVIGALLAVVLVDHTLWQGSLRTGLTTARPILAGRHPDVEVQLLSQVVNYEAAAVCAASSFGKKSQL